MRVETILEQLMYATMPIETFDSKGEPNGLGTGFIIDYVHGENHFPHLVTNKHIVRDAASAKMVFTQSKDNQPVVGASYTLEAAQFGKAFSLHPSDDIDVAVLPFGPFLREIIDERDHPIFYRSIQSELIPSQRDYEEFDAMEEIIFVGYPGGFWDTTNLHPVFRRGISATRIASDYRGSKKFLIDAAVFNGSSGSPVFLLRQGPYVSRQGTTVVSPSRLFFLGIVAKFFITESVTQEVHTFTESEEKMIVQIPGQAINLGIVFKADTIIEAIEGNLREKGLIE